MAPDVEWASEKSEPEPLATRFARWRHHQLLLTLLSVAAFVVAVSAIAGLVLYFQYRPYRNKPEIPQKTCEKMYCAFGARCRVDHVTQQAYCRCEDECPEVFAPVCGNDGSTYASLCHLQMSACSQQRMIFVHHQGPCDVRDPCLDKECHFGSRCRPSLDGRTAECTCLDKCATYGDGRGSRPVCGSDGRDYPNECELERTACREMREISIKYQGHCGMLLFKEQDRTASLYPD